MIKNGFNVVKAILNIFVHPGKAFSFALDNPRLILVIIFFLLATGILAKGIVTTSLSQKMMNKATSSLEMQEPVGEPGMEIGNTPKVPASAISMSLISSVVFGILGLAVGWLFKTAFFLAIAKLKESKVGFLSLISVMGLVYVPFFVRNIWQSLAMVVSRDIIEHQGLSALVATSEPIPNSIFLYGLYSQIDIFVIWSLILLFMALNIAANLSKRAALITIVIFWLSIVGVRIISSQFLKGFFI